MAGSWAQQDQSICWNKRYVAKLDEAKELGVG